MKQNIHKKVRPHFKSVRDVEKLWNSFKTVQVDRAFLSINPPDGPSFQILVTRPKKRIKGCKVLLDNVPFSITALSDDTLTQILSRLFLLKEEPTENSIVDIDRKVSGTNMISTRMFIVFKVLPKQFLFLDKRYPKTENESRCTILHFKKTGLFITYKWYYIDKHCHHCNLGGHTVDECLYGKIMFLD
eukprot:TRINITY_DN6431_c0_g1_i4.p2 TRINITY_DN6431_c0_g1~~TRINITY_DN6431_c0_g1_i4.p2  ORF type:complete len:188 (-),score=9.24 TRINITY_DN6431_c0_g1_i4:697-1260(-)